MARIDKRWLFLTVVLLCVITTQLPLRPRAFAADAPATPASKPAKLATGLIVSFSSSANSSTVVDAHPVRLAALFVAAGSPASPALPPGPFHATWTGFIQSRIKDEKLFAADGRGDLKVALNDAVILDVHGDLSGHPSALIKLLKGRNRLVIDYTPPADGDAAFRLLWADKDKPFDPVLPTALGYEPKDEAVAAHASVRAGRELVATLRCVNCHKSDAASSGGMPELRQDAPNLSVASARLRPQWLAYWISNPRSLRADATMPRVLHDSPAGDGPAVDPRAQDIAAYLTTNAPAGGDDAASTDETVVARGGRLFTGLGCVACHVAPGIDDSDATLKRVTLKYVKAKYRPAGLIEFLKKPEQHYAWIRMPEFRLADDEATALASFLLSRAKDDALPAVTLAAGDAAKGKQVFESVGCVNCHAVEANGSPHPATAIELAKADWSRGCAADDVGAIGKGVDFAFAADQRAALRAFGPTHMADLSRDPLPEFAARQMNALRCNACHSIDDRDNSWANLDDEIQRIEQDLPAAEANDEQHVTDQSRPPLTWVGEKLHAGWMGKFIAGQVAYKPRQWILARMPGFPARAQGIANGLAMSHGLAPSESAEPPVDAKLADVGRSLTSRTGFGCVACHGVGDQPALAPFEAPSINFAHVTDRMRHDFFSRWIRHPQYYLPGTKMPQFSDANGKTAYKNVFSGDAAQQYEAIWQYLRAGDQIAPPQ